MAKRRASTRMAGSASLSAARLSRCRAFVARTWPPRAGKITLRPWRSRESRMGREIPSRGLAHRGDSHRLFQGGLRVIFRNATRRAPDTFRPNARQRSARRQWRAPLAVRVEPASEPCRAATSDNLPNARQRPTPSAAAKSENGVRRFPRQGRDVRALAPLDEGSGRPERSRRPQVGRHGEAAGLDANGQRREPMTSAVMAGHSPVVESARATDGPACAIMAHRIFPRALPLVGRNELRSLLPQPA